MIEATFKVRTHLWLISAASLYGFYLLFYRPLASCPLASRRFAGGFLTR